MDLVAACRQRKDGSVQRNRQRFIDLVTACAEDRSNQRNRQRIDEIDPFSVIFSVVVFGSTSLSIMCSYGQTWSDSHTGVAMDTLRNKTRASNVKINAHHHSSWILINNNVNGAGLAATKRETSEQSTRNICTYGVTSYDIKSLWDFRIFS